MALEAAEKAGEPQTANPLAPVLREAREFVAGVLEVNTLHPNGLLARIDAALAEEAGGEIASCQAIPEGWKLVPVEPWPEMIEAGWIDKEDVNPEDIYRAMLAAAPLPPAQPDDGWKDIASAPKDGTPIELYRPPAKKGWWKCRLVAIWHAFEDDGDAAWIWPDNNTSFDLEDIQNSHDVNWISHGNYYEAAEVFTHWRELPEPPKGERK